MSRLSPFLLNDLVLSLLSLQCPFCPSHKRLKFAETVYDMKFIGQKRQKDIKGTFLGPCFSLGAL